MKRFVLGIVLAIGLAGCQTATPAQQNPAVAKEIERSLTIAHISYNAVGQLILAATSTGQIKGSTASNVKIYYDKAGDALVVADRLDAAGNTSSVLEQVNLANQAIADATKLVKGN